MRTVDCCREIRIELIASPMEIGDVVSGFNSITNTNDSVIVVKPMKDRNKTVVCKYTPKQHKKYIRVKKRMK